MVVDSQGRGYVSNLGFQYKPKLKMLGPVDYLMFDCTKPNSEKVCAKSIHFGNGVALSEDGKRLVVAESFDAKMTEFDVDTETGDLSNKRLHTELIRGCCASLTPMMFRKWIPDGIS